MSKLSWSEDTEEIINNLQKREKEINKKREDLRQQLDALEGERTQLTHLIRTKLPNEIPAELFYGSKATISIQGLTEKYAVVLSIQNEKAYRLFSVLESNNRTPKLFDLCGEEVELGRGLSIRNTSYKTLEVHFNLYEFYRALDLVKLLKLDIQASIQKVVDSLAGQISLREEIKNAVLELRKKE